MLAGIRLGLGERVECGSRPEMGALLQSQGCMGSVVRQSTGLCPGGAQDHGGCQKQADEQ